MDGKPIEKNQEHLLSIGAMIMLGDKEYQVGGQVQVTDVRVVSMKLLMTLLDVSERMQPMLNRWSATWRRTLEHALQQWQQLA